MTESQLFDRISMKMFGRTWSSAIMEQCCVRCGEPVIGFKDENMADNYREYGYCAKCQCAYDNELHPNEREEPGYDYSQTV